MKKISKKVSEKPKNKGGRPKIASELRRDKYLQTRFSAAELKIIRENADNSPFANESEYVRRKLLGGKD